MNRGNPVPARRPFQLVRGGGAQAGGEAEQLDRFLIETDPILIASLRQEERSLRRRKMVWSLALFLGIAAAALPTLWLAGLPGAMDRRADRVARVASDTDKARLLIEQGKELLARDRYNEALDDFTLAASLAPGLVDAWTALANCQLENYQSELTETAYRRALALEPGNRGGPQGAGRSLSPPG